MGNSLHSLRHRRHETAPRSTDRRRRKQSPARRFNRPPSFSTHQPAATGPLKLTGSSSLLRHNEARQQRTRHRGPAGKFWSGGGGDRRLSIPPPLCSANAPHCTRIADDPTQSSKHAGGRRPCSRSDRVQVRLCAVLLPAACVCACCFVCVWCTAHRGPFLPGRGLTRSQPQSDSMLRQVCRLPQALPGLQGRAPEQRPGRSGRGPSGGR